MQEIGKIDIAIYQRVSNKAILTDEVVLTNNRMEHIIERRGLSFYETYRPFFSEIIRDPDYVFSDKAQKVQRLLRRASDLQHESCGFQTLLPTTSSPRV